MCFVKHTLSKHTLGRLGLKPRPGPLLLLFGLSPAQPAWAGLDPANPARSLAQASDPAGQQARVVQTTRALHRAKVINYLRPVFFFCNKRCRIKGKRKALPGDGEGEGGDEDESGGLVRRMFFFPLLLRFLFVMGSLFL